MQDRVFIDTNVLIYLYSKDEIAKSQRAERIVKETEPFISTQVVNELANVLYKKFEINPKNIAKVLDEIGSYCKIVELRLETIHKALHLMEKFNYAYYDSLILASALESECRFLYQNS